MTQTLHDSLKWGISFLKEKGIDNPRLDSEILLARVLCFERQRLLLEEKRLLDEKEWKQFHSLIQRRAGREPVSYLTGEKEFWSLNFKINRDVLIPRPETEFLVEGALEIADDAPLKKKERLKVLDLGTGCGNIAVTLAKERKNIVVYAVDQSEEALKVADGNIKMHSAENRVVLLKGDFSKNLGFKADSFDMIVSNPPYVAIDDMDYLAPEVRDFEPAHSLNGGTKGLELIRNIVFNSPCYLKTGGFLLLEIGKGQKDSVLRILKQGSFDHIRTKNDLAGIERVIIAQRARP
jgi:release factor glutamine methyltransferase